MLYRLYQPGDFAQLYVIEELCFQPPLRFSRTYMRQLIQGHRTATWVAEENGQLAGFAIVEFLRESGTPIAYIQTIEVDPNKRERGIASELLRRIENSAHEANARTIWLHVDAENSAAIRLYERHGYKSEGREEHYYTRNRAALIYAKAI
jgi:ribosomal protein S18 acetylase RimI-like enzyme